VSDGDKLAEALDVLRRSFDASFAAPPPGEGPDEVALLAIRIGSDPAAVRVHDTLALLKAGPIVPVPSRRPELLGVTGVRGAVVPVYSLSRLTGRGEGVAPRWIVLAGGADRVGLAFAGFDAHVRVRRDAIHAPAAHRNFEAISGVVEIGDEPRPIIDVPAIVQRITGGSDRGAGGNS
jgi:purine-binding chemotaxis protein CheW